MRGLMADTIVRARISSPFSSTTPTARPFSTMILRDRSIRADGHAGLLCRQLRLPRSTAPMPPLGMHLRAGRAADFAGEPVVEAEQRGRRARAEMAAERRRRRRAGLSAGRPSRCSSSTSATFIRSMRRKSRMSSLPSRRSDRPVMAERRRFRKATCRPDRAVGARAAASGCRHSGRVARAVRSTLPASAGEAPTRLSP